jgi:hypothetical protein
MLHVGDCIVASYNECARVCKRCMQPACCTRRDALCRMRTPEHEVELIRIVSRAVAPSNEDCGPQG